MKDSAKMPEFPTEHILGVRVHSVKRSGLFESIDSAIEWLDTPYIINDLNVHGANLACKDDEFRHILNHSHLVFVDGVGIMLGAKVLGKTLGDRLTYADWMDELFERCAVNDWGLFFLGDTDETAADFRCELKRRHPKCRLVGTHHGFFRQDGAENQRVLDTIKEANPQVVLVGMSMPIQEKWVWRNREQLPKGVYLSCGGFPRIYTGNIPRGPKWMTDNGLEWLYRLIVQPKVWRRYVLGNPLFLWRVLVQKLTGKGENL